jgi:hypothetical protein
MGSGKKFVPNGVFLRCSKGTMFPKFNVTPKTVSLYGEQMATEFDMVPMMNIPSFGLCTVTKYCPPCMPIPTMWQGVCSDNIYVAFGRPLLEDSTMQCALSGKIEIMFTLPRFSSIASLLWNVSAIAQGIADIAGDIEDAAGEIANAAGKVADYARKAEFGLKVVAAVAVVAGVVCLATGVGAAAAPFLFSAANVAYRASNVAGKVAKGAEKVQSAAQNVQAKAGRVRDLATRTSNVAKAAGDFAFDPSLKTGADLGISVLENVKLPERKNKKQSNQLNADSKKQKKSGGGTAGEVKNASGGNTIPKKKSFSEMSDEELKKEVDELQKKKLDPKPIEKYDRKKHYRSTPNTTDRKRMGLGKDEVADHRPPLIIRYYYGNPPDEKPGYQMTPDERKASAEKAREQMRAQPRGESNKQGAEMSKLSRSIKKQNEL